MKQKNAIAAIIALTANIMMFKVALVVRAII